MRLPLLLAGLLLASPALADTTAVYAFPNDAAIVTVEIASGGNMRITVGGKVIEEARQKLPTAQQGDVDRYGLIVRDGEGYVVQPGRDGSLVVARQGDMDRAIREILEERQNVPPSEDEPSGEPFVEQGTVTVGGRTGRAFYRDADRATPAVVVAADPDLAELAAAMQRQYSSRARGIGVVGLPRVTGPMRAALAQGAPIAMGGMQLRSVKHDPIPAARFALPQPPRTLDQLRAMVAPKKILELP